MFFFVILAVLVLVTIPFMTPVCVVSSLSSHDLLSTVQNLVFGCVVIVDAQFVCQLLFPSAFNFRAPRERIIEAGKSIAKPFNLILKPDLRFTSLVFPCVLIFSLVTTLLFTPIWPALEVSVDDCFRAARNLLHGCIVVLDAHFVLQLFFPHTTILGALYECAFKSRKLLVASFSRFDLESALALSMSLHLVYVVCVRGYIILTTLGMKLLAFLLFTPLRVFDSPFTSRLVLPTTAAAAPDNTTNEKRNVQARPMRPYLVGEARRKRSTRPAKKAEHFVTPPEAPSTPITSDTESESLVQLPQSPTTSLPELSASSTYDSLYMPSTPRSDSSSPPPAPSVTFSSTSSLASFINAFLDSPTDSELNSRSEPPSQAVQADDEISALADRLKGFKLDLKSEATPIETKRPAVRSSIACQAFVPSTNPGPVVIPRTTLDTAGWEKAILETWFLSVVAPGDFHDIYKRNLKMLRAGHVAGRFARC
ncbi:hypothetical protein FRC06_000512 [Ceratobasidium sp. 370]|nr:hypothetical protein FRC06_000512 [Ceratobasidium sp. 370]